MKDIDNFHPETNQELTNETLSIQKSRKRMPVWMLIITDILLTLICLGLFMLYHYVLPRHLDSEKLVVATVTDGEDSGFTLPGNDPNNNETDSEQDTILDNNATNVIYPSSESEVSSEITSEPVKQGDNGEGKVDTDTQNEQNTQEITNYGNSDTLEIEGNISESEYISSAEKTSVEINSYNSDNIQFTTEKVEIGSGIDKITYYISDIYVTNVKYLKSAFATGEYGKNLREATLKTAEDNNALMAINGDFYGNSDIGVVIRNGILYRSDVYDADICVLFTDGTMKTYTPEAFDAEEVISQGAWQAWIFGPQLLDGKGNILSTFNSTVYLSKEHPRTAIGYVEPGHYVFVVVDGRDIGYSKGVTLSELGQIMVDAGCVTAYNLDGGKSSAMVYGEGYVNQPAEGGRTVSDIIYIGE